MSVIGDNIKALRNLHGLTQQQLADIAGVSRETVNKWETGSIGNVRTSNIEVLRNHFHLSVDDLRSETLGLAAKAQDRNPSDLGRPCVPVLDSIDGEVVEIPATILAHHPNALAYLVPDDSMGRAVPDGCVAIIDPVAKPGTNSIILADLPDSTRPVLRRLHPGSTKALLSAEGFERREEDVVLDLGDFKIRGVVVWYQAEHEMA